MSVRIVLFDWDGTLINSLDIKVYNAGVLFQEVFGLPAASVETSYRHHSGVPRRMLFDAICSDHSLPVLNEDQYSELSRRFSKLNRNTLLTLAADRLLPTDAEDTLRTLQQSGYILYVSSSAEPQEIQSIARALKLEDYFLLSGGELLGSTPGFFKGKQHVNYVTSKHKAQTDELVFVGDEPNDLLLGKEAGVFTILKVGTYTTSQLAALNPPGIIQRLGELPVLLRDHKF